LEKVLKFRQHRNYIRLLSFGVAGIFLLVISIPARAQSPSATLAGSVLDAQTGSPIPNATVVVNGLGATHAVTDAIGNFVASDIPVADPFTQVTITISALGHGTWTMRDTPLYPGITRTIRVRLPLQDQLITDTLPRALIGGAQQPISLEAPRAPQYFSNTLPPQTINVAITNGAPGYTNFPYCQPWLDAGKPVLRVDAVNFRDYVKNVLPHEWIASWPAESLRAGAMAVKMYGWYIVNISKWSGILPGNPDIVDNTCDQVYVPSTNDYRTDAAVDWTWLFRMRRQGVVDEIHYLATVSQCQASPYPPCMPQWGSYNDALNGMDWQAILHKYYDYDENNNYIPVVIDTFGSWYYFPIIVR
jgi:carboxypeptidase family protein/stage II sporulation SpoD-like protein